MHMTDTDWIDIAVAVLIPATLIIVAKLKIWHALVVFGVGVWFSTTPPGQAVITWVQHLLSGIH